MQLLNPELNSIFLHSIISNFDLNIFNISFDKYGIILKDTLWFIPIIRQSMKSLLSASIDS